MVNGYRRDVKHYAYGCSKFFFLAYLLELPGLMLMSDSFRCSPGIGERMTLDRYIWLRAIFSHD